MRRWLRRRTATASWPCRAGIDSTSRSRFAARASATSASRSGRALGWIGTRRLRPFFGDVTRPRPSIDRATVTTLASRFTSEASSAATSPIRSARYIGSA
ncbi:MAG: hypothetical protein U0324_44355 [Polyangiales bacterium]